jgi:hypothetical protein
VIHFSPAKGLYLGRHMKKNKILQSFLPVLASSLFVYIFILSSAEKGFCFNISPQVVDVILSTEEEYNGEFNIFNNGNEKIKMIISLEEFFSSDTALEKDDLTDKSWINIFPAELDIPAGASEKCMFKIKLPKGSKGEYRVYAFFQDITPRAEGQQINIGVRFGSAICAVVKNTEAVKGEISNIQLAGSKPGRFWVGVYNGGNVHCRSNGNVIVKNRKTGKEVIMPINTNGISVLPLTEEKYMAKGDVNLEPGFYSATAQIIYGEQYGGKALKLTKSKIFKITLK